MQNQSPAQSLFSHHQKRTLDINKKSDRAGTIFLITFLGGFIRAFFVWQKDFPLNDGGMFYTMVQDLEAAHFRLPAFTTYNHASIPFAYSPLPFYLAGFLNTWFKIDLIQILRFLPLFFSIITIPAFYWLARQYLHKPAPCLLATLIFAVLPPTYTWQIMGGGLTRSIGFFFMLLALAFYLKFVHEKRQLDFAWMIVFAALTTLCHIEMVWVLALSFAVVFLFERCTWKGLGELALAVALVLALTSLWWIPVVAAHGVAPFLNAFQNGGFNIAGPLASFLGVDFVEGSSLNLFAFLALIGVFLSLREHNWIASAWWVVFILFDQRSIQRAAMIPIALLAGLALDFLLQWVKSNLSENRAAADLNAPGRWIKLILTGVLVFALFNNLLPYYSLNSLESILNQENRSAMLWVKGNTPPDSRFLLINYPDSWSSDRVGEWFPALSDRKSILTTQGAEWLPDKAQSAAIRELIKSDACRQQGLECFQNWIKKDQLKFDYVYFTLNDQPGTAPTKYASAVEVQLGNDSGYELVYANDDVRIFKRR